MCKIREWSHYLRTSYKYPRRQMWTSGFLMFIPATSQATSCPIKPLIRFWSCWNTLITLMAVLTRFVSFGDTRCFINKYICMSTCLSFTQHHSDDRLRVNVVIFKQLSLYFGSNYMKYMVWSGPTDAFWVILVVFFFGVFWILMDTL